MKKNLLLLFLCLLTVQYLDAKLYVATHDIIIKRSKRAHASVLGVIKKGASIDATEIDNIWAKIKYNDRDAYIKTKFLKAAPEVIPAPPIAMHSKWTTKNIILVVIGGIVSLFILRNIFRTISGYFSRNSNSKNKVAPAILKPTHWYQCQHCRAAVKKHMPPSETGCVKGAVHNWIELAEVGVNKYFCRHCATTITAKSIPIEWGCPGNDFHFWTQLS
jgi:hypothetical protein